MSILAGPLKFDAPTAQFLNSIPHLSASAKTLLLYDVTTNTRRDYNIAIRFCKFFYASRGISPWPATAINLIEWVNTRTFELAIPNQRPIQPDTIAGYLSGLRSYHVD